MKKIKVISCIITIMIMALIFFFSSQSAEVSKETSSGITMKLAEFICKLFNYYDTQSVYNAIHTLVRKLAHFTLFGMLGVSAANTAFRLFAWHGHRLFLSSLAFCVVYAATDEIHQIFVQGRAGRFGDVMIDTFGAACGIALFILIMYVLRRKLRLSR